jgi:hypothetical protein
MAGADAGTVAADWLELVSLFAELCVVELEIEGFTSMLEDFRSHPSTDAKIKTSAAVAAKGNGDCARLAHCVRCPAEHSERNSIARISPLRTGSDSSGGTPVGATGAVTLLFSDSFLTRQ